jgi:hypothetical protein
MLAAAEVADLTLERPEARVVGVMEAVLLKAPVGM